MGCSFASQLFRTAPSADALTRRITQAGLHTNTTLSKALAAPKSREKILIEPLQAFFRSITVVTDKTKVSISVDNQKNIALLKNTLEWRQEEATFKDDAFRGMLHYFLNALDVAKDKQTPLLQENVPGRLYPLLERILWEKSHHLPLDLKKTSEDGYGSDSDTEGEVDKTTPKLYAKKCITATGMRAIQLSFAAGRVYLERHHKIDVLNVSFNAIQMYYETEEALKRHAIPVVNSENNKTGSKKSPISLIDINYCNTTQVKNNQVNISTLPTDCIVCILDITSATTAEIREHLQTLFRTKTKLCAVLLVASGLKNQQAMSDCNPYGEIRIFAKSAAERDSLYNSILEFEKAATLGEKTTSYKHPKESHAIRKYFKSRGLTLSNASIFASTKPQEDEELQTFPFALYFLAGCQTFSLYSLPQGQQRVRVFMKLLTRFGESNPAFQSEE